MKTRQIILTAVLALLSVHEASAYMQVTVDNINYRVEGLITTYFGGIPQIQDGIESPRAIVIGTYGDDVNIPEAVEVTYSVTDFSSDGDLHIYSKTEMVPVTAISSLRGSNQSKTFQQFNIPPSIKILGKGAFDGCTFLNRLYIPSSVEQIEDGAFGWISAPCIKFDCHTCVPGSNKYPYVKVDTIIIGRGVKKMFSSGESSAWSVRDIDKVIIEDSSEPIEGFGSMGARVHAAYIGRSFVSASHNSSSFSSLFAWKVTSVVFGDSVTTLSPNAVQSCSNLQEVIIGKNVQKIEKDETYRRSFIGCNNLKRIILKDGPTPITLAGIDSDSLRYMYVGRSIANKVGFSNLTTLEFGNSVREIRGFGEGKFKELHIPEGVTYIDGFNYCDSLEVIELPNTLTFINGISWCNSLKSIAIPNGITTMERFLLNDCENLSEVIIPEGVTHIESCNGCHSLTEVTLPNSLEYLGGFSGCSLSSVTIPENVTEIGREAFSSCPLEELIIPSSVKTINQYAFDNCNTLKTIILGENVETIVNPFCRLGSGVKSVTTSIAVYAKNPPAVNFSYSSYSDFFSEARWSVPLYVPDASVEAYKKANGWRNFTDIRGLSSMPSGISDVKANGKEGSIYNMQGVRIANPQKGLYIMNGKKVLGK